jgi:hypothetical protein
MTILWSNVVEHGTALSVIAKGSQVCVPENGLKWEINYGDWYNDRVWIMFLSKSWTAHHNA